MLAAAGDITTLVTAVAKHNICSRTTVRRIRQVVAAVILRAQWAILLWGLQHHLRQHMYAASFIVWDETGQRLAHPLYGKQTFEALGVRGAFA